MIHNVKGRLATRTVALLIASWIFGWFFDAPYLCLFLAIISLLTYHVYHLVELVKWLASGNKTLPPDSFGTWGQIYDHLQEKQLGHSKEIGRYKHILKRVQASTEALADAVIIINKDSQLLWWNPAAKLLLNLKRKVDSGQLITNLIREPRFFEFLQDTQPGSSLLIQTLHNPPKHIQITKTIYGDAERLLLLRDISNVKLLEKTRRDFISNASHELRTPLTVLKGYLETFEDYKDQLPITFQRPLGQMQNQTKRMENLVRDLLALSKLEEQSAPIKHGTVNLTDIINEIIEDAKSLSGDKNHQITFKAKTNRTLQGDASLIGSAISNLVFNAVRYSPDNTKIKIKWNEDGTLVVKDKGIGIASQHIERLTERFYRIDESRSSDSGGTGLGLAIVKHIMLNHQGELKIQSTYGEGSKFVLVFPEVRLSKVEQE